MSLAQDMATDAPPLATRVVVAPSRRRWTLLRRVLAQPKGAIGLILVVLYLLLAILGPMLAPQDAFRQNFAQTLRPPSAAHWFGTDQLGRDVFSRVLVGARATLGIGVGGVAVAFLIGVPLGILAAWRRGWVEALLMRAIDIMLSFPDIVFALAVVAILGANTQNVIIAVGVVAVPVFARTARAVTLSILAEPYIEGSAALGASPARIILRHVQPNIAGTLLTLSTLLFASTLLSASGLGFLGLGTQPPYPEWGTMLGESRSYIRSHPYLATFPGLFLAGSALAFNLLGEALRVIYDPTSRRTSRRAPLFAFLRRRSAKPPAGPLDADSADRNAVSVKALRMAFRTRDGLLDVVRGVDLAIRPGRTLALVGESGSGKSTLLRAIGTLANPQEVAITDGAIGIGGESALGLSAVALRELRRRKIGVVFQDAASALNPVLTIGAQLAEAVRAGCGLDDEAVRQRCIDLLKDVRIADPERRLAMYPHQFSGGMKQRIVIAIALAQDPQVLLADEPTSALDVTIQQQILVLLREIQETRGMAMLLVTHDLSLVSRFADDVAVMYAGRIVESGEVATVLERPLHPYALALRASAPGGAESRGQPLRSIPGEPPLVGEFPDGCAFRPRCPRNQGRPECAECEPEPRAIAGRQVACLFAEEGLS
ncbi:MAG: dipeptide/oligopeptide/nickel ABC transporter permease/ATP-binding protein [Bosea sp.]|uniref:dipeptide/oligopeptide/nickel ABC transporter permease/ATP-binding protein n=1 Tax=unclassified Bosea (in: a-proteobacteria) TaxID=2653178 RepID=UPI000ADC6A2A|nr:MULTISPECIES: dipeptide/oligopeptide/nickel ABC transporter permease/ATP-binding protein [unclassified Bosea (in: a-proteobacteria)]MBN9458174.1 dipeptide/oligopeptide/nickel ABC transporter permease/ATP-binding protein [Bosea sp. (in: a-proteobacteria)]